MAARLVMVNSHGAMSDSAAYDAAESPGLDEGLLHRVGGDLRTADDLKGNGEHGARVPPVDLAECRLVSGGEPTEGVGIESGLWHDGNLQPGSSGGVRHHAPLALD